MKNNKGSLSIFVLMITAITLIMAVFIFYLCYMNNLIVNSDINNKQAFYLAEEKIYLCMYKDKYLYNEVKPRIEHYLKYGNFKKYDGKNIITIEEKDLSEKNNNMQVKLDIFKEKGTLKANLLTSSTYNKIKKNVVGTISILNPFCEKGLAILSANLLDSKDREDFNNFIYCLIKEIDIPKYDKDITGIKLEDYKKVCLLPDFNLNTYIAYAYKDGAYYEKIPLKDNKVFLILKNNGYTPSLYIESSDFNSSNNIIEGVIYVEGDLILYDNVHFCGIIIVENGSIIVNGLEKPKIDGLLILNNYNEDENLLEELIDVNYDKDIVYKYGNLLPNFIEPKLYLIKELEN